MLRHDFPTSGQFAVFLHLVVDDACANGPSFVCGRQRLEITNGFYPFSELCWVYLQGVYANVKVHVLVFSYTNNFPTCFYTKVARIELNF